LTFTISATDPLAAAVADRERELFKILSRVCAQNQMTPEQVANVALNLVCNAVRQGFPTKMQAERAYDEIVARMKGVLLDQHYDAVTGRRRHNFAWDQNIVMPFNDFRDKH
jgi:chorismate mutase